MPKKICKGCDHPFEPYHPNCQYCSNDCRAHRAPKLCKSCGQTFRPRHMLIQYCSDDCRTTKAPAVYRFVSPDGRSHVGSVKDSRNRAAIGIYRSNERLEAAFEQYPPETFVFEILEQLQPGCTAQQLRKAEQRHINRLRSWKPEAGFNVYPAIWKGDGPSQRGGREFSRARIAVIHEDLRQRVAAQRQKWEQET
jgi:hypothetical protein